VQLDNRLPYDDNTAAADQRVRLQQLQHRAPQPSPGTPADRTLAGGPTPVSRVALEQARDALAAPAPLPAGHAAATEPDNRSRAERELERMLQLPSGTELDIEVDYEQELIRFQIRDRATGELIREVPQDETRNLLEQLHEFSGVLVDRAF